MEVTKLNDIKTILEALKEARLNKLFSANIDGVNAITSLGDLKITTHYTYMSVTLQKKEDDTLYHIAAYRCGPIKEIVEDLRKEWKCSCSDTRCREFLL